MERSPLLERHVGRGARLADRPEAAGIPSPLTFGDVPAEYEAGRARCALLDSTDRGRLTVRGRDSVELLHRLLANHVKNLAVGSGNSNLLLSSKGKVLFSFDLVRWADRMELSTPPGRAEALRAALERYLFAEDALFEASTEAHAPLELCGPDSAAVLARALGQPIALPRNASAAFAWMDTEVVLGALTVAGSTGYRIDAGPALAATLWDALERAGAAPCGLVARDCLRVEAGAALEGLDVDENVYPQEARLEESFALDKGCYVGQEVVAKIDTYGGLNKRLCALRVSHSDPVPRGTLLLRAEDGAQRELGLVTSWAYSFVLDGGLALGYVKRRHQEPGTEFELGAGLGRATIVPLPVRPI